MRKCSNCDQKSSRRWNLETHIKRKHNQLGEPINLGHIGEDFLATRVDVNNHYKLHQYQNNGIHNAFKTPLGKTKKSLKESLVFVDEIYDIGPQIFRSEGIYQSEFTKQEPFHFLLDFAIKRLIISVFHKSAVSAYRFSANERFLL